MTTYTVEYGTLYKSSQYSINICVPLTMKLVLPR